MRRIASLRKGRRGWYAIIKAHSAEEVNDAQVSADVGHCRAVDVDRWGVGQPIGPAAPAAAPPTLGGCPVLPADNIWNVPVDTQPLDPNSNAYINTIGANDNVHADFGPGLWDGAPIGIPFIVVPSNLLDGWFCAALR